MKLKYRSEIERLSCRSTHAAGYGKWGGARFSGDPPKTGSSAARQNAKEAEGGLRQN